MAKSTEKKRSLPTKFSSENVREYHPESDSLTNADIDRAEEAVVRELDYAKLTEICEHLREDIREIFSSCGIFFRVFLRVKSAGSMAEKICRGAYGTEQNPKKIQDLLGLRVVLYYYDDMSICRDIMEKTFCLIDDWSRAKYNADEFRATKINGVFRLPEEYLNLYKKQLWSLPIDTTFEVQFRTVFFEGWHEIEHDMRYKSILSDEEFWHGSEELSRILNCILANLELSDWSLVQLFDKLSYNHYQNANWELMLKSKYRIRINDNEPLDARIKEIFDSDNSVALEFYKIPRKNLLYELLRLDNPHINYNLIIRLLNDSTVHNKKIAEIFTAAEPVREEKPYKKNTLAPLETSVLFHLEQPLLHKPSRTIGAEFHLAALTLYKWARFKMSPVFPDMPEKLCTYRGKIPGYRIKVKLDEKNLSFYLKVHYIDSEIAGTLWDMSSSVEVGKDHLLHFSHRTTRDMPRGVSSGTNFYKPSFLQDLSHKVGITDVERLTNKAQFVTSTDKLSRLKELVDEKIRRLPIVVVTQHTCDLPEENTLPYHDYDMDTFTVNGTRLAKVIGYYAHVFMVDFHLTEAFGQLFDLSEEDVPGCVCIFWPNDTERKLTLFTRKMVVDTHFDFNRYAFQKENISEKAFRHKLVQMIKDDHVLR